MTAERRSQVRAIYREAKGLPADIRSEFLQQACAGDPALLIEVEALFTLESQPGASEDHEPVTITAASNAEVLTAGTRLGPWSIGRLLGRGGMGEVYEANRADGAFDLRVALKLLKRGLDTGAVVARFTRERRILARLEHPNIAHVIDAGVAPDGRPFLVMEYVDGRPITEYVRVTGLSTGAILRLMITVCAAVQAAHAQQIVHRDLKPSNVLITAQSQVKLLDFGIAKVLTEDEADFTRNAGEPSAMTPDYAAPEQLLGLPQTTASDVYALGVILYQLLVERLPHARTGRSTAEIAKGLDRESIERPSIAIRGDLGRMPEPLRQARLKEVSGDLDLIVLKALHAEAPRRYLSAHGLADDLHRLLESRPILARPDSVAYRLGRFARRNRRALVQAGAAAAAVALVAGGLLMVQARRHAAQAYREHIERLVRLGQEELKKNQLSRAATYLTGAYSAGNTSVDVRYFLGRVMPAVEALAPRAFPSGGFTTVALYTSDGRQVVAGGVTTSGHLNVLSAFDHLSGKVEWSEDPGLTPRELEESHGSGRLLVRGTTTTTGTDDDAVLAVFDVHTGSTLLHLKRVSGLVGFSLVDGIGFGDPELDRVVVIDPDYRSASIWSVAQNRALLRLAVPQGVVSAEFSPDGSSVVTGSRDGTIVVWNSARGTERLRLVAKPRIPTFALYVSRNRILTINRAGVINLWDAASGGWLGAVGNQVGTLAALKLSPDRGKLFTAALGATPITIWDLDHDNAPIVDTGDDNASFSTQGNWMVTTESGSTLLWSLTSNQIAARLDGQTGQVIDAAFSPDGQHLLTFGVDAVMREWNLSNVKPYPEKSFSLPEEQDPDKRQLTWARFDARGRVITTGSDGVLRTWNAQRGEITASLPGHSSLVSRGTLSRDTTRLITASDDLTADIWDLNQERHIVTLNGGYKTPLSRVSLSSDGARAMTVAEGESTALLWDATTGVILAHLKLGVPVSSLDFSPDGSRALTGGYDGGSRIWDIPSGHLLLTLKGQREGFTAASFTPNGAQVLTVDSAGDATLWDARDGHLQHTLDEGSQKTPAIIVAMTRDSRHAAFGGYDGIIRFWDLTDGTVRHFDGLAPSAYFDLAFSPDQQLLAAANGNSGIVGLWSVATGRLLWTERLNGGAWRVAFDPTGTHLIASGLLTYNLPLWDISLEQRDPAAVAAIVDCKSPWVLNGETLASRPAHPEHCAPPTH
jgi:WD40 repeat protein/tRNA A-37 threonylcarbamoyl transferase component Bud32